LWRADFARIDRACQRFAQVSRGRPEWGEVLEVLLAARSTAWQRCVAAAALDPRTSAAVPGDPGLSAAHRALAQAAVQCAQAAQAVVMAGAGDGPGGDRGAAGGIDTAPAARAARRALDLVTSIDTGLPGSSPRLS